MRLLFGVTLAAALSAAPLRAQVPDSVKAEVLAPVRALFDAMRAGDSTAARAAFHPGATLGSAEVRDGVPSFRVIPADRFVEAVGRPHDKVWDERVWDEEVRVDGNLATVWMRYAFYLGDALSHCGVNAMELFRSPEGWRITRVADTRRRDGCTPRPRQQR